MTAYDLLRSAYHHAMKARHYAQESRELAVAAMVSVVRCYREADALEGKVLEAARPHLEQANQSAKLAEFWVGEAEEYAVKARLCALKRGGYCRTSIS
jgi:hypothetical protein